MQATDQNIDDVANLIMGGMPEDDPQTDTEDPEGYEDETDVDETEVEEAEADPEAEDADDAEDEDEDDETEEDEAEPELHSVKVDGEEQRVTYDELLRGYAGQSYIQKGMERNAQKERETEQVYKALREREQQLDQLFQQAESGEFIPQPRMPEDDPSDPIGNSERWGKYHRDVAAYQQQQQQRYQIAENNRLAREQAEKAHIAEQQRALAEKMPEYVDPNTGDRKREKLREDAKRFFGVTDEVLSGVKNVYEMEILHHAVEHMRLQTEGKAKASEKSKAARKVVKPGKRPSQKKSDLDKARQQMRKTGSVDDVANYFLKGNSNGR